MVKLVTISDLAREYGCHRFTMARRLLALHERHGGDWLVPTGVGQKHRRCLVNVDLLRQAVPGMFEPQKAKNLESDVEELLSTVRELKKRLAAQGARIRELEGQLAKLHEGTKPAN